MDKNIFQAPGRPAKGPRVSQAALLAAVLLLLGGNGKGPAARGQEESPSSGGPAGKQAEAGAEGPVLAEKILYWQTLSEKGQTYIVDGAGNRAPLVPYQRIILTSPGAVEVLYMIGAESAIAAVSSGRDPIWPEDKTVLLPSVGNTARPSLEPSSPWSRTLLSATP
jgi:ABC-type Fe3+-hydroxamate transport system substrate-binding protein